MKRLALLISALSAGCTATGAEPKSAYSSEMEAYIVCNLQASKAVSSQPGDPMSLAVAARGLCGNEELALNRAIDAAYRPDLALKIRDRLKMRTIEQNTTSIVTYRARAR